MLNIQKNNNSDTIALSKCIKNAFSNIRNKSYPLNFQNITRENLEWNNKKKYFKVRNINFILSDKIIGDISNLNEEQKNVYINILKNSTHFDSNQNIINIGLLNKPVISNIINNEFSSQVNSLNLANQKIAKHIVGFDYQHKYLQNNALKIICKVISNERFMEEFASGTLDDMIKNLIGNCYSEIRLHYVFRGKGDLLGKYESDDEIIYNCLENKSPIIGPKWSNEEKYNNFIKYVSQSSRESDWKAIQILLRGFIWSTLDELTKKNAIEKVLEHLKIE